MIDQRSSACATGERLRVVQKAYVTGGCKASCARLLCDLYFWYSSCIAISLKSISYYSLYLPAHVAMWWLSIV